MTRYAIQMVVASWVGALIAYFFLILPSGLFVQPAQRGVAVASSTEAAESAPEVDVQEVCPEVRELQRAVDEVKADLADARSWRSSADVGARTP